MKDLKNKTAIVTGGSKGIGRGIVEKLAVSGCNVAFTYQSSEESAVEIEKLSEKYNVKIKKYKSDASDFNQSSKLIEDILNINKQSNIKTSIFIGLNFIIYINYFFLTFLY